MNGRYNTCWIHAEKQVANKKGFPKTGKAGSYLFTDSQNQVYVFMKKTTLLLYGNFFGAIPHFFPLR